MIDALITTDSPLAKQERETLLSLVGMMVPASEEYQVPGADDAQIFARILATPNDRLATVTKDLAALDQASLDQRGDHFPALKDDERMPMLMEFGVSHPMFIPTLIGITLNCYYSDDRVLESLNMEARPPYPEGFIVEQGDWSLLDPVRQRPKMYREDS